MTPAPSTTTASEYHQLLLLGFHNLLGLCQYRHQVLDLGGVVGCEEGVAGACVDTSDQFDLRKTIFVTFYHDVKM